MNTMMSSNTFANCPDLAGLDDASRAFSFMARGGSSTRFKSDPLRRRVIAGRHVLPFALGGVAGRIGGKRVGRVPKDKIFGEMAYFIKDKTRTATIRAGLAGSNSS